MKFVVPSDAVAPVATLVATTNHDHLLLQILAVDNGDPAPPAPPGRTDRLWEYEVVEFFLAGPRNDQGQRYVEVEVGPHGHFLAYAFSDVRVRADDALPVDVRWIPTASGLWSAEVRLALTDLPARPWRANTFSISGLGELRRWRSAFDLPPTSQPDFHRPADFPLLDV